MSNDQSPLSGLLGPMYTSSDNSMKMQDVREGFLDDSSTNSPADQADLTYDEVVVSSGTSPEEIALAAKLSQLVPIVKAKRDRSKRARMAVTEPKWISAYYAWRGEYSPEEKKMIAQAQARNPYNSQVFIKITKTKVMAAYGQLLDIILANNKIPLEVKSTSEPEGIADTVFVGPPDMEQAMGEAIGYEGDGRTVQPGENSKTLLGGLYDKYKQFVSGKAVAPGTSPDPKQYIQISPAEEAAADMQKVIIDQLEQGEFKEELRKSMFEAVLYGTGFMKGPMTYTQVIHNWVKDDDTGETNYEPVTKDIPKAKFVSVWNLYPDPDCAVIEQCEYIIERHLMHRHEFRALRNQPGFYKPAIDRVLRRQPKYMREYWETIIQDAANYTLEEERYEVLEYWGYLDRELLANLEPLIDKDDLASVVDMAHVNIWICNDEVLRIVINPYVPQRTPYYAVPYETHPHQIWGIGIAENMEDTQGLMNGHMRMGIDNLKLSGNVMLEVNEAQMVPNQEMTLYPGKIFRRQGGAPGQSIFPIQVNNTTQQHLMMYDKARQLADEATGMPSYAQGQSGVTSQPRTAAGTSMLMGQASMNIKTVVRNFDHYLLRPLGEAFFHWNMQFNDDHPEIKGDLKVLSNGTSALMQKEVQSHRLLSFLQLTGNQLVAPFVNVIYLVKQIATSLDLDPEKAVNDPQNAAMMADIMGRLGGAMQPQQQGQQPTAPGSDPQDTSGGGGSNIGVGSAPAPNTQGFSANDSGPAASQ
jgi:hypothetical protein